MSDASENDGCTTKRKVSLRKLFCIFLNILIQ